MPEDDQELDNTQMLDAVIVGVEFAGMYSLHRMLSAKFTVRVIAAGKNVARGSYRGFRLTGNLYHTQQFNACKIG